MERLVFGLFWLLLSNLLQASPAFGFSNSRNDNLAVYWGQDSAGHQQRLSFYCQDDTIDIIPLAFLYIFRGKGGLPVIDFSNICGVGGGRTFAGSDLVDCSFLEQDIKQCQAKGKIIVLSLGGAVSKVGFSSDGEAAAFGQTLWDMFLGGKGNIRPLGNVALDGIDLDIETGTAAHYAAMVNKVRSLAKGASKKYYVTAAPQCPFPDQNIGAALNSAPFDAVFVQFYNNYCETSVPNEFNFGTWDHWAKTQSANPNVKVYLGAPAAAKAALHGYVDIGTLASVAKDAQKKYSSFGGVMLWDADVAYTNNHYDRAIKSVLTNGASSKPSSNDGTTIPPTDNDDSGSSDNNEDPSPTITLPTLVTPFKDPRKTARVKRPSYSFDARGNIAPAEPTPAPNAVVPRKYSRFFRF